MRDRRRKPGASTLRLCKDAASFTLPVLEAGTYDYTLSYAGDDQIAAFTESGSLTVAAGEQTPSRDTAGLEARHVDVASLTPTVTSPKVSVGKVKGVIVKAPTSKKGGKYKVAITTPKGASAPAAR